MEVGRGGPQGRRDLTMSETLVPDDFRELADPLVLDFTAADGTVPLALTVDSVADLPAHRMHGTASFANLRARFLRQPCRD